MAEEIIKARSFRISDEVTEKFRLLCGAFDNQNTALSALISAYEVQQAKAIITERQTDISDYDTHLQALQSAFLHSLEITENTETRIRAEFQKMIDSKDQMIQDLQERIRQAEQTEQTAREQATAIECEMSVLNEQTSIQLERLKSELDSVRKALDTATEQVTDKQSLLDEYRTKLEKAEKDVAELPELKERVSVAEQKTERLTAELNKQKSDFETKISVLQERAEIEKEKAVIAEQQAFNRVLMKQNDEIKSLYSDKDQLRQEIKELQQVIAELHKTSNNKKKVDTSIDSLRTSKV